MSHAPKMRERSPMVVAPPVVEPTADAFSVGGAGRLLADVRQPRHELIEFSRCPYINEVCGQVVAGEAVLVAGAPGSNKSTLTRQLGIDLALQGKGVLFILTEESPERLKAAVLKQTSEMSAADVRRALSNLHVETSIRDVLMLPNFLAQSVLSPTGAFHGVSMIVIDSIQGPGLSANDFDRWQALFQATTLTRAARVLTFLVCHVTKAGSIAGPKALEHAVDCTILIRKAYTRRQINVMKNRFGPETARPLQLALDPTTVTLLPCPHAETMTAVARGWLPGLGITEVQGAVTLPRPGTPARVVAPGLPRKEIDQYLSGICQISGFELADFDLSIQCRLPGERRYRNVLGLPLCMALASSYVQRPVPPNQIHLGEIDLMRQVRDVPPMLLEELEMAIDAGDMPRGVRIFCPPSAAAQLPTGNDIEIVQCRRLDDAIFGTWPALR